MLGINLRQRDERSAIARPRAHARKIRNARFDFRRRAAPHEPRKRVRKRTRDRGGFEWMSEKIARRETRREKRACVVDAVTQNVMRTFTRPEQIRDERKARAANVSKKKRRPSVRVDASLHGGDLEIRVELDVDRAQLARLLEIEDAFAQ